MSTRTRTLEEMRFAVENARKVGWFTDESADTIREIIRKELLRALREEGDKAVIPLRSHRSLSDGR